MLLADCVAVVFKIVVDNRDSFPWAILPHSEVTGDNFERVWYETAQRMGHALSETHQKRVAGKPDYLKTLDEHIKSAADWRAQNE